MTGIRVVAADDRRGLSAFIAAARRAEAMNPRWVEPLHDEVRMTFDPKRAPFRRENVIQPFVAFRDGDAVGRIVATIETAHLTKFDDACGTFGFLEAIDDPAVFDALFAAAEGFLRDHGMQNRARAVQPDDQPRIRAFGRGLRQAACRQDQPRPTPLRRTHRAAWL